MEYFPLYANLKNQPCLVVGGGSVAARKIDLLRRAGARITVNAPQLELALEALAAQGEIRLERRTFDPELIVSHLLIIAATPDTAVNAQVAAAAAAQHRLCNVVDDAVLSGFIVPAIVDRSPIMVAVSSGGAAPVLATLVRNQIEGLLPESMGRLANWAAGWRTRVRAALPDARQRRELWRQVFSGRSASALYAGNQTAADEALQTMLQGQSNSGEAWIVGAGPGDPGLLTLHAARCLRDADIILHDRLVAPAVLDMARRDARRIPVGKAPGPGAPAQQQITTLLVELVRAGNRVCRLKGGDPFVFGRGGEEAEALAAAGLPFQIIPGITAANGCAAYAGIPLTHRDMARAVTLVTAQGQDENFEPDWGALAGSQQTLVFYMGAGRLGNICSKLIAAGRAPDCPAAIIENGTTAGQRLIRGTLAGLPALAERAQPMPPALVIIGEVVGMADRLSWFIPQGAVAELWNPPGHAGEIPRRAD